MSAAPSLISDFPRHHAANHPDRPALIHHDATLTYAALADRVDEVAARLLGAGVRPGERVAMMGTPRPDVVVAYLATASIGAVWLGLNPRYTVRELAYVLGDAQPVLILCALPDDDNDARDTLIEALDEAGLDLPVRDLADLEPPVDPAALEEARRPVRPEDPALIVYTSGSTGQPKGALIRHSGLVRLGVVESGVWQVDPLVTLCNLPINHIGCVGDLIGVPLVAGGTLVLRDGFDAVEVLHDIETHRINALFQIPTQLQRMCTLPEFEGADLSSLTLVGWGGSPLPQDSIARYRARGCKLIATYGLTEATSSVTYTDLDAPDEVLLHTVGRPDPGMDVRLRGEDGTWVEAGEEGEVCVRNDTTMAGYLNRPEATAAAHTPDGWLRTGDIGFVRPDGNLVLVGRVADMFKSGGYNIYPREIELVLEAHPAVHLAAVVPRPDPQYHEVGVAFVQVEAGTDVGPDDLKAWARERLANFKVPKSIVVLSQLPLLPVGKVDKAALRAEAQTRAQTQPDGTAPGAPHVH